MCTLPYPLQENSVSDVILRATRLLDTFECSLQILTRRGTTVSLLVTTLKHGRVPPDKTRYGTPVSVCVVLTGVSVFLFFRVEPHEMGVLCLCHFVIFISRNVAEERGTGKGICHLQLSTEKLALFASYRTCYESCVNFDIFVNDCLDVRSAFSKAALIK